MRVVSEIADFAPVAPPARRYNAAMSGVTRYILRQLFAPMLFVVLALTGVIWLTQSLRFIDKIVSNGLSVAAFLQFTSLLLPRALAIVLPIALFLAVLHVYNRLRTDSELVVLWAAGLSKSALARPALLLAAAVTLVTYGLTLYLAPLAHRTFKDEQYRLRSDYAALLLQEGVFNTLSQNLTVYIRERQSGGEMVGILVHDGRDRSKPVTMMAERGALVRGPTGPRFVMVNGNRQQVDREKGVLSLLYFDKYSLDLSLFAPESLERWRTPGERFLGELLFPGDTPEDRRNRDKLVVEGHRRLTAPLYTIVLTLIALSAVLAGEFNRRGQVQRILAAAAAAVLAETMGLGLTMLTAKLPVLIPVLYLYVIACAGAALFVLGRRPRRGPTEISEAAAGAG